MTEAYLAETNLPQGRLIEQPADKKEFAINASGEIRRELETQIRADYNSLTNTKTNKPERWEEYLSVMKKYNNATDEYLRDDTNSDKFRIFEQAENAWHNHEIYKQIERLDKNNAHLETAIASAIEYEL